MPEGLLFMSWKQRESLPHLDTALAFSWMVAVQKRIRGQLGAPKPRCPLATLMLSGTWLMLWESPDLVVFQLAESHPPRR